MSSEVTNEKSRKGRGVSKGATISHNRNVPRKWGHNRNVRTKNEIENGDSRLRCKEKQYRSKDMSQMC